tara:strand:- start:339 stop:590 length:252 start_codon:yes stop_codon:yes gene_type:complete
MIKIFQDSVTKELVIENGIEYRYPAFCEIQRQKQGDYLLVKTVQGNNLLLQAPYTSLSNEGGTVYSSFASLKSALDGYFNAEV